MAGIGSAPGIILGVGVGTAAGAALAPAIEVPRQTAWAGAPNRILEAGVLAQLVARGGIDLSDAAEQARRDGYDKDKLEALIYLAQNVPGAGEALALWRLGLLTDDLFEFALTKAGLDPRFAAANVARKTAEVLDLGAIATAVHRGIMDPAGLLVQTVPTGPGNVPRIPVSTLDTIAEFAAQGVNKERARVLVADTGLPLSLGEMLSLLNRGKVTETDVKVSIAESNVRNEYMDVALELRRRLLTPHEQAESELRGIKTRAEAQAGANLSGLTDDDYETLFAIMGRPLNVHEITTARARGGTFGGGYEDVPEPYQDAIRRSAIRPEYAGLAYANRYTYPSAFVLRSLAEAGDLGDTAAVAKLLEEIGWKPSLARQVAAKWAPVGATVDPHITKARSQLWTTTHSSYAKGEIGAADAQTALPVAGVDPASVAAVLEVWDAERALIRKQLSVAQIRKAVSDAVVNVATGLAWTVADAIAALMDRGYSQTDAQTIMAEA